MGFLWQPKSDTSSVKQVTIQELQMGLQEVRESQQGVQITLERIETDLAVNTAVLQKLVEHLTK